VFIVEIMGLRGLDSPAGRFHREKSPQGGVASHMPAGAGVGGGARREAGTLPGERLKLLQIQRKSGKPTVSRFVLKERPGTVDRLNRD
jgi:hypothetical protein